MLEEKGDRELSFLRRQLRIRQLSPLNVDGEFQKVLQDHTYNPQFTYSRNGKALDVVGSLHHLKFGHDTIGRLLNKRRDELVLFGKLLHASGTKHLSSLSQELYGKPSQSTVKKALDLVDLEEHDGSVQHTPASSIKKFLDGFLQYGLQWKVVIKDMVPGASFSVAGRKLFLNRNRRFSEADIQRLMVHEIGTHIMRAEQGRGQKLRMFVYGFPGYLTTEEGLAVYNEERAGLLSSTTVKHYAGRVLAVHLSLKNSFSTVYNSMIEHFKPRDAFLLALRAKRGFSDTSLPGAFTKDHVYLTGYFLVKEFIKHGGNIHLLYTGKVGVEHTDFVRKLLH